MLTARFFTAATMTIMLAPFASAQTDCLLPHTVVGIEAGTDLTPFTVKEGECIEWVNKDAQAVSLLADPAGAGQPQIVVPAGAKLFGDKELAVSDKLLWRPEIKGQYQILVKLSDGSEKLSRFEVMEKPADFTVSIDGRAFVPATFTIPVGAKVRWVNISPLLHTVTFDAKLVKNPANILLPQGAEPSDSGRITPQGVYEKVFTVAGDYKYACVPHEVMGHLGALTVTPEVAPTVAP
jgi:plastocyanin